MNTERGRVRGTQRGPTDDSSICHPGLWPRCFCCSENRRRDEQISSEGGYTNGKAEPIPIPTLREGTRCRCPPLFLVDETACGHRMGCPRGLRFVDQQGPFSSLQVELGRVPGVDKQTTDSFRGRLRARVMTTPNYFDEPTGTSTNERAGPPSPALHDPSYLHPPGRKVPNTRARDERQEKHDEGGRKLTSRGQQ